MISAVAARKAALATQGQASFANEPSPSASTSTAHLLSSPTRQRTHKRKSSAQETKPSAVHKKARKLKPFEKSNGHKVDLDAFKEQVDMVLMDLDSEGRSGDEMSMLEDSDDDEPLSEAPRTSMSAEKRAWSPSRPTEDSSDEDTPDDLDVDVEFDVSTLLPSLPHSTGKQPQAGDEELSTYQPTPDMNMFYLREDEPDLLGLSGVSTIVCLNQDEALCLLGTCALRVLQGSITLLGAKISASSTSHSIYAPRSAPLPIIKATQDPISLLKAEQIPKRLQSIAEFAIVLALQELPSGVADLGRVCPTFEGVFEPSRWQKSSVQSPFRIHGLYMVSRAVKDLYALSVPPSWATALLTAHEAEHATVPKTIIIKGPKNSGKSTLARTLVNTLLQSYRRVAFLECDIGQSEFTPGGLVALNIISRPLFGPPFTHPTLPSHAHFIGSVTPRSTPSHYLEAISALIQTYRLDIQHSFDEGGPSSEADSRIADSIPLVVNTMGWVKGLGADLTQKIESDLEPTDIFDIQAAIGVKEQFPATVQAGQPARNTYGAYNSSAVGEGSSARVHNLESISSATHPNGFTAADHRTISLMSYFHAIFPAAAPDELVQVTALSWDTMKPLCAMPPYEIEVGVAFDKVILTGAGSEDVVEEEIRRVLNGAVVGLVACDPGAVDLPVDASAAEGGNVPAFPYTREQAPPSPASSNCIGLAVIRGVSQPTHITTRNPEAASAAKTTTYLHLLTPLPTALLSRARVLMKGEMELPVWGMLDFRNYRSKDGSKDMGDVAGVEAANVPYLQWGKAPEGVIGADKRKVRRNLMRRGQM